MTSTKKNIQWTNFALGAIVAVRANIYNSIARNEPEERHYEDSVVGASSVGGAPEGRMLIVPQMVINPLACNCIGVDPEDREWDEIQLFGYVETFQHNVDSYADSLPLAAGLAAINTKILASS